MNELDEEIAAANAQLAAVKSTAYGDRATRWKELNAAYERVHAAHRAKINVLRKKIYGEENEPKPTP